MRAEELSVEDNLACPMCKGEPVLLNFGDDFRTHLVVVHQVAANFNQFMEMAVKKKMRNKLEKKPETIKIVDVEPEPVLTNKTEDAAGKYDSNIPEGPKNIDNTVNTALDLDKLKTAVNEVMNRRFSKLTDILEGKTALECKENIEDGKNYEEELKKEFSETKLLVKEKSLPKTSLHAILKNIKNTNSDNENINVDDKVEDDLPWYCKGIFYVCKSYMFSKSNECGEKFTGRNHFMKHLVKQHGAKVGNDWKLLKNYASKYDDTAKYKCKECSQEILLDELSVKNHLKKHSMTLETYTEKHENKTSKLNNSISGVVKTSIASSVPFQISQLPDQVLKSRLIPSGRSSSPKTAIATSSSSLSPAASDNSTSSGHHRNPRKLRCAKCEFTIDQSGIHNGAAAKHLKTVHKLTGERLKHSLDEWKFIKI